MSVLAANYAIRFCRLQDSVARHVLTVLGWATDPETPDQVYMSNEAIREATGLRSANGVKDALRRLIEAGELEVVNVGGRIAGTLGVATEFYLPGVRRHMESDKVSNGDGRYQMATGKVSNGDGRYQMATANRHHLIPIDKDSLKDSDKEIAPATSSPSLPTIAEKAPKPKKAPAPKFDPSVLPLPHGSALTAAWAEFAQHRREIKAPLTPTAAKRILDDLGAVNVRDALEALRKSVKHGWRGVFVERSADPVVVELPPKPKGPSPLEISLAKMRAEYGKEDAA